MSPCNFFLILDNVIWMLEDRTSQSGMFWRIPCSFLGRIKTDGLLLRRIFTKLAQPVCAASE